MVVSLFKCLYCGLQKTVKATPEQLHKPIKCPQCGCFNRLKSISKKTLDQPQGLPIHQKPSSALVAARFKCSQCHFEKVGHLKAGYGRPLQARCSQCQAAGTITVLRQQIVREIGLLDVPPGLAPRRAHDTPLLPVPASPRPSPRDVKTVVEPTDPEAFRYYKSLFRRYPSQPSEEIFAFFPYGRKQRETWLAPFQQLANIAKPESWNFQREEFRKKENDVPILINYLNFTFIRLLQQNKVHVFDDRACFNTGLQTAQEKDIYAVFSKNRKETAEEWYFNGWVDSYDLKLDAFRASLPTIASYAEDISDLFFDVSYDIDINIRHIVDDPKNRERLPVSIRDNAKLAMSAIQNEVRAFKDRCIRNYKLAVPCWYPAHSKVQLLLPVYIDKRTQADLALVADKDKPNKLYRIRTALTMDMAYSNARLITHPNQVWLNP